MEFRRLTTSEHDRYKEAMDLYKWAEDLGTLKERGKNGHS